MITPAPRVYVFDLDGVLYRGSTPIDGAADALFALRRRIPTPRLFFLTNNSSQTRATYVEKLGRYGISCTEDEIVTSASATADYLESQNAHGKTAVVVGGAGIRDELARIGMNLVPDDSLPEKTRGDYVVVGLDRGFNFNTLWRAQHAILHGATFVATNRDGQFPIETGVTPGGGAMVAALVACTEMEPVVVGKPETLGLRTLLERAAVTPAEAVMVGDRLDTDIACANRLGVPSVLVLTGVTDIEKAQAATGEQVPGRIIGHLREL